MSNIINKTELEDANTQLEDRVNKSRASWNQKIISLIESIKDINKVAEAQIFMLSYRHQLTDKMAELKLSLYKVQSRYDFYFKQQYRYYRRSDSEYDLKLNGGETSKFVAADITLLRRQQKIIESHIEYYQEVVKTLDNLGFAIKRRMELSDELNR